MKQIRMALLLVLCIALAFPAAAEDIALVQTTFEPQGFSLGIPEGWEAIDMLPRFDFDEADLDELSFIPDVYMAYGDSATSWQLSVICWQTWLPDDAAIAEMEADFGDRAGWEEINGIQAFVFVLEDDGACGAYFRTEDKLICVTGRPAGEDAFVYLMDRILTSIELTEEA